VELRGSAVGSFCQGHRGELVSCAGRARRVPACAFQGESVTNTLTGVLLAAAAGLNAFLPILGLALADRFTNEVDLPQPYNIISSVGGIAVQLVLVTIDLIADKIPRIDHINDLINSPIRPAAGMFLMMAAVTGQGEIDVVVAMFIGLLVAAAVHVYKSINRTRITIATNGLANPMVSLIEDGIAGMTTLLAIVFPWVGLAFAIPAGIGLGWVYRKTSGPNNLIQQPGAVTDRTEVVSETTLPSVGRKPKRTVGRGARTKAPAAVQPDTPDA